MSKLSLKRRTFLGTLAGGSLVGVAAVANPGTAAAQAVGVKPTDLPDLTIKEVKVYEIQRPKSGGPSPRNDRLAAIVTNSGIEGNDTLVGYWQASSGTLDWLGYAKRVLKGKSVLDLPALTSQWEPNRRRSEQNAYASVVDCCLWDALGKAVGLPVYRILGAYRDRVLAYASSQHHATVEEYVAEVQKIKAEGFKAYKVHEVSPPGKSDYKLEIEVAKAVRKAAGDDFPLLSDPICVFTREEAFKVGRVLQDLNFVGYEDPLPTADIDGLAQLCRALDIPIHVGEFIYSPYHYAEYIRRGALDVVRFIVDHVGGITGAMKVSHLAEGFQLEVHPHNWGDTFQQAVHFHCELAMPNNIWYEVNFPQGLYDLPFVKDRIRIAKDGYVYAPTKPGLGYEIDRDVLDKMIVKVDL
jgi:L-alanine-DL-glutamate epimerase-like enolase superfamily enzyme